MALSAADAAAVRDEARVRSMLAERMLAITGMPELERLVHAVGKLLQGEKPEDQRELAGPIANFLTGFSGKADASPEAAAQSARGLLEKAREIIMVLRIDTLQAWLVEIPQEFDPSAPPSGDSGDDVVGFAASNTLSHIVYACLEAAVVRPLLGRLIICFNDMAGTGSSAEFAFDSKRRELRQCNQEYFGIAPKLQSPSGWASVIAKVNSVETPNATGMPPLPSEQLASLVVAAGSVYTLFTAENTSGKFISGDDFLPIFIYVVVQSQLSKLDQMWHYMFYLADPVLLTGEGGYYLGVFEAAIHYIRNWFPEQMRVATPDKQLPVSPRAVPTTTCYPGGWSESLLVRAAGAQR